jgi:hemerythrin superfamily protein
MKATELLQKQHRKVERLFDSLEKGRGDSKARLRELANDLAGHMAIEQEIFYPRIRDLDVDLVTESFEEHAVAELALKRLLNTSEDDVAFHARVKSLKELIQHHVKEEEAQLFPKVDEQLEDEEATALAKQMKARFQEVAEAGYESVLPKGPSKTSADKRSRRPSVRPAAH